MIYLSEYIPWNKGKKMSDEYKRKLSEAHKGQVSSMKGKHHTEEAKRKMSIAKLGKPSPRKGVVLSDEVRAKMSKSAMGKKVSEETKRKIGNSIKGHPSYTKGMKWSDETKEKMSVSQKQKWANKTKEQREAEVKCLVENARGNYENTDIEVIVENELLFYGIRYVKQKYVFSGVRSFVLDFYLPDYKLVIECNGDYWHNLPRGKQRDKELKEYVESTNHNIVFIWEHEILDEWFDILDYIKDFKEEV